MEVPSACTKTAEPPALGILRSKLAVDGKNAVLGHIYQSAIVETHPLRDEFFHFKNMTTHLPNYLRSSRKRLALSQEDVAFLLGVGSGAKVCRHERFARAPEMETLLAYEVIFQRPLRELFGGIYRRIEREVAARARTMANRKSDERPNRYALRKLETLRKLATLPAKIQANQ